MERQRVNPESLSHTNTRETPTTMVHDVINAAAQAYTIVGNALGINPEIVYASSHCFDVCDVMIPELSSYKIKPVTVTYLFIPHRYLIVTEPVSQKHLIADGMWRQMLSGSARTSRMSKILIGTPKEVVGELRSYGLTQEQTIPWTFK